MTLNPTFTPASVDIVINPVSAETSTGIPVTRDYVNAPPYEGEYEIIPSETEQIIHARNMRMTSDVTIAPIPQNYGLITWDGTTITVS